jgi:mRNA-degrading endonuclease toxin of MazEF toxin-antitoxin module
VTFRGAVVVVGLDPTIGYEQNGVRPCVVVSDPDVIGDQRFRLVCVGAGDGGSGRGTPLSARIAWPFGYAADRRAHRR